MPQPFVAGNSLSEWDGFVTDSPVNQRHCELLYEEEGRSHFPESMLRCPVTYNE